MISLKLNRIKKIVCLLNICVNVEISQTYMDVLHVGLAGERQRGKGSIY